MPSVPRELMTFAKNLWENFFKGKVQETQSSMIRFYRAKVVAARSDGKITVQRSMDNAELNVGYVASMAEAAVGEQVVVIVFGDGRNAANHKILMYPDGRNL